MSPKTPVNAKIKVPQADGEIVVSFAGDDPVSFAVHDHVVTVPVADAPRFAAAIDGSQIIEGAPLDQPKE